MKRLSCRTLPRLARRRRGQHRLPPLERFMNSHGSAYAEEGGPLASESFWLLFWGNGVIPERWVPGATGQGSIGASASSLSRSLSLISSPS